MKLFSRIVVVLLPIALSACAWTSGWTGTPHYTLITPMASAANTAKTADFALNILPIGIPAPMESTNMVIRRGPTQTEVLQSAHWSATFSEELRAAVSLQLANTLRAQDIAGLQTSPWNRVVDVKLQIRRFDSWLGHSVAIDAAWSATMTKDGAKNPLLICSETIEQPAPGGLSNLVGAQQAAVQALSAKMGAEIQAWITTGRNDCVN